MISFACVVTITILTVDYNRLKETTEHNNQLRLEKIEDSAEASLHTIEKAYYFFDQNTAEQMRETTAELLNLYKTEPDVRSWNYAELKDQTGMDIYIIDKQNTIIASSYEPDIGLNFNACCSKLIPMLEERRRLREFHHDGMDIEQSSGRVKKYSYAGTDDGEYLIQLGKYLDTDDIFQQFNIFGEIKTLVDKYDLVDDIHVLNLGGRHLECQLPSSI
ncbi:hypothetical protein [Lentibacillus sp. JNUCC-1]|uniref:hypothetical protein n=1 Tax=Lentibacillus sp. JNUCC-1 TaxID=2654513 RepID=UPI0018D25BC6|nr:hypothetical protein [Lentibacillus sp. JNUCC-1]